METNDYHQIEELVLNTLNHLELLVLIGKWP